MTASGDWKDSPFSSFQPKSLGLIPTMTLAVSKAVTSQVISKLPL